MPVFSFDHAVTPSSGRGILFARKGLISANNEVTATKNEVEVSKTEELERADNLFKRRSGRAREHRSNDKLLG